MATLAPREFDTQLLRLVGDRAALASSTLGCSSRRGERGRGSKRVQAVTDVALAHLELEELLQALLSARATSSASTPAPSSCSIRSGTSSWRALR